MSKMGAEIEAYALWRGQLCEYETDIEIVQEKDSNLQVADADSDILFDTEKRPLSREEYDELKALVLKSASDFYALYSSISNKMTVVFLKGGLFTEQCLELPRRCTNTQRM